MKKSIKILSFLMTVIMITMVATPVFATTITPQTPTGTDGITTIANKVLGLLQWIAGIGSVIVIAILGIKYMLGSLEEKADYKKSFVSVIIGIVVVNGAIAIANLLTNTFTT